MWAVVDSNHRSRRQRIYSPLHLATLVTARVAAHFYVENSDKISPEQLQNERASGGSRTPDQLITNQLLWPTELHWQKLQTQTYNELAAK